eukprot:TRINITY_DN1534_c0_g1_i5.p1 TRINITY_DN1534_c0_g1~~TRINITY_DN1534_c0_g1_i5.p1  ORF type:complete len:381 (-),score=83.73 TRINITY_DN1534_c0_g1_i5:178-1320(-)
MEELRSEIEDAGLPPGSPLPEWATLNADDVIVDRTKKLGSGSYGHVYMGVYFGSPVAVKEIKVPRGTPFEEKESIKLIKREVAILRRLRHPNIVQFIGVTQQQQPAPVILNPDSKNVPESPRSASSHPSILIVMEYMSGGDLHQAIKTASSQDLPWNTDWAKVIKIALDVASAMAYLHANDIVFRDLKAKNILVDDPHKPSKAKICDFGLARLLKFTTPTVEEGTPVKKQSRIKPSHHLTICGSDDFMAPEVILGEDYDNKSDVFSFGIVLLEILITTREVKHSLKRGPASLFELNIEQMNEVIPPSTPQDFRKLVFSCTSFEAVDRPTFPQIVETLKNMKVPPILQRDFSAPAFSTEALQKALPKQYSPDKTCDDKPHK